jgi:hypothetical protein
VSNGGVVSGEGTVRTASEVASRRAAKHAKIEIHFAIWRLGVKTLCAIA